MVISSFWLALFGAFANVAVAVDPTLTVLPETQPLRLTAIVENDPIQLEGVLWATLEGWPEGKQGPTLSIGLADEILRKEGADEGQVLGVTHLSFEPTRPVLQNRQTTAVKVTVNDVEWPGLYRGKLTYSASVDEAADDALKKAAEGLNGEMILELDVRTKPRIVAPQQEIAIQRVRCWWLGCTLAGWFLADDSTDSPWPVELRNDSLSTVMINPQTRVRRQGSPTAEAGFHLSPQGASKSSGDSREAAEEQEVRIADTTTFDLNLGPERLRAGRYEGDLLFVARPKLEEDLLERGPSGAALVRNRTDVTVKMKMDVRAGVVLPLLLVLLGIVAGRLNREISTPEAQARYKLYDRTVRLRDRIDKLADEAKKRALRARLASARRDIEDFNIPDDEIRQALDQLDREIKLLEDEELQRAAGGKVEAGLAAPVGDSAETISEERARPRWPRLVKFLAVLAGTRRLSVRAGYWYYQPLATVALLVALTVYGVFLFYTGAENSTFGANGVADYFPLFLWGFGSDVLTKRLNEISFTRS